MTKKIIAIEEHYIDPIFIDRFPIYENLPPSLKSNLLKTNEDRIKDLDKVGIDMQILSHNHPGTQIFSDKSTIGYARQINDNLKMRIDANPDRFGGFATLPMQFPEEAAMELDRCVTEHGFYGAMLHGNLNGEFFDTNKYRAVFQVATEKNKPVYIHPGTPVKSVTQAYYADYLNDFPLINTAAWGFGIETSTAAVRLILSGIFKELPDLKIIIGHMGEGLPFFLERCHAGFSTRQSEDKPYIDFRNIFRDNFFITTSGNFSNSALQCSLMELGVDKILFAVDTPYNDSQVAINWISNSNLSSLDLDKIMFKNAINLLGIDST